MAIDFLDVADVLHLHADQITAYGGALGVRDLPLLESAVAQARSQFDCEFLHKSIHEMAAAYLYHIVQNHPFVDGNKRAGAIAALVFLDINGVEINAPKGALFELTMAVARSEKGKTEIAEWFRQHEQ
jgi:death on curing protein